jgi:hypothetical protein
MEYSVRPIPFNPADYATYESLLRVGAFVKPPGPGASSANRQSVIEYVVKTHALTKTDTKSISYDPNLDLPGRNIRGDIRIGPLAFDQDISWLAGIVFHELIHSPQYAYYAAKGVTDISPARSETERLMIAVDEYEAHWWSLRRSTELSFSKDQQAEIKRRVTHALIDVDDARLKALVQAQRFDAARDDLIKRYKANPPSSPVAKASLKSIACCA